MPDRTSCSFNVPASLQPNSSGQFDYQNFVFSASQQGSGYVATVSCDGSTLGSFPLSKNRPIHASVSGPSTNGNAVGTLSLEWDSPGSAALILFDGTLYGCVAVGLAGVPVASFD
jgi:hypothetical protein